MRCVIQRVSEASVRVDGEVLGQIGPGYVALIGVEVEDTLDFIGVKERLVFRSEVVNGERFLNISSREFVEKI